MNTLLQKALKNTLTVLGMLAITFGTLGVSFMGSVPYANATENDEVCSTITLTSGSASKTAGHTETNPLAAPLALSPSAYSEGSYTGAINTETVIPPWTDPASDSNFTDATWISSDASWPGGSGNSEGSPSNDQWRLFSDSFTLPEDAVVTSATLAYTADNAVEAYLNDSSVGTTDDVYGAAPESGNNNYASAFTTTLSPSAGENTIAFVVRNWSSESATNPTGLVYKAVVDYCVPAPTESETSTVTIVKYVDGTPATAESADTQDFPMVSTWNAENTGAGSGSYVLSAYGFGGDTTPYQARTAEMTNGASYSTNEETNGPVVGLSCELETPYMLMGYSVGSSLSEAENAPVTMTAPAFTNIVTDQFVIVWNEDCSTNEGEIEGEVIGGVSGNGTLEVTSITAVDTSATANGSFADGWEYVFNITVPSNETNLSMKFADWMRNNGGGVIPVANNMRLSSAQADNGGAYVMLTAANVYSTPALHMTGDLDTNAFGHQVQVTVEVAVPAGSANGTYSTNYGVQTLP